MSKEKVDIIKKTIEDFYKDEAALLEDYSERIFDYLDDDWEEEYDSHEDWYRDYGGNEVEYDISNEILKAICKALDENTEDFYYNGKYGDIDDMVEEVYPLLKTK